MRHQAAEQRQVMNGESIGRIRWRSCKSKRRYRDYWIANHYGTKYALRVYGCELCNGFHLTKQKEEPKNEEV